VARSRLVPVQLDTMAAERERLTARGLLSPLAIAALACYIAGAILALRRA